MQCRHFVLMSRNGQQVFVLDYSYCTNSGFQKLVWRLWHVTISNFFLERQKLSSCLLGVCKRCSETSIEKSFSVCDLCLCIEQIKLAKILTHCFRNLWAKVKKKLSAILRVVAKIRYSSRLLSILSNIKHWSNTLFQKHVSFEILKTIAFFFYV